MPEDKFEEFRDPSGAAKALTAIKKIPTKSWKAMGNAFRELNTLMSEGGLNIERLFGGPVDVIKGQIETAVTGLLAPFINEITSLLGKLMDEGGLMDALQQIGEQVGTTVGYIIDGVNALIAIADDIDIGGGKSLWDGIIAALSGIPALTLWIIEWFKQMGESISSNNPGAAIGDIPLNVGGPQDPYGRGFGPGHYLPDDQF
jgi:hypothetical protein